MNGYDESKRRAVFGKTNGHCHICHGPLAYSNYGNHGTRGAWEIDHSIPRARGGTDHLNNLYPAHTSCNRCKQHRSNAGVRREYGQTRAPLSAAAMEELKAGDALTGALSIGLLGARFFGPAGFLVGAVVGAIGAFAVDRGPG
jgi:hypothetical protein